MFLVNLIKRNWNHILISLSEEREKREEERGEDRGERREKSTDSCHVLLQLCGCKVLGNNTPFPLMGASQTHVTQIPLPLLSSFFSSLSCVLSHYFFFYFSLFN
jgi:hypothetical protein